VWPSASASVLGPALGGYWRKSTSALPLLVAVSVAILTWCWCEGAAGDPAAGRPAWPCPASGTSARWVQLHAGVSATPRVRRLCAAFFLFFLAFRRLHRRAWCSISNSLRPGARASRQPPFLGVGAWSPPWSHGPLNRPLVQPLRRRAPTLVGLWPGDQRCLPGAALPPRQRPRWVFIAVGIRRQVTGLVTPLPCAAWCRAASDGSGRGLPSQPQGLQSAWVSFIRAAAGSVSWRGGELLGQKTFRSGWASALLVGVALLVAKQLPPSPGESDC